jgi:long-chain fatty acid transport protein
LELESDGDGWGYNLGLLVKLTETIKLGLAYRSAITVDMDGDLTLTDIAPGLQGAFGGASYRTSLSIKTKFPDIYSIGLAYSPGEKWTFAADFELVRWKSFDTVELDIHQEVTPILVDISVPLDWTDSQQFKVGVDYRYNDQISLRGGYAYITTPVPDHTLEPSNPDADMHNLTIGIGYRNIGWTIDGYYDLGIYENRRVENVFLEGKYGNRIHLLGLSGGYRF